MELESLPTTDFFTAMLLYTALGIAGVHCKVLRGTLTRNLSGVCISPVFVSCLVPVVAAVAESMLDGVPG